MKAEGSKNFQFHMRPINRAITMEKIQMSTNLTRSSTWQNERWWWHCLSFMFWKLSGEWKHWNYAHIWKPSTPLPILQNHQPRYINKSDFWTSLAKVSTLSLKKLIEHNYPGWKSNYVIRCLISSSKPQLQDFKKHLTTDQAEQTKEDIVNCSSVIKR